MYIFWDQMMSINMLQNTDSDAFYEKSKIFLKKKKKGQANRDTYMQYFTPYKPILNHCCWGNIK